MLIITQGFPSWFNFNPSWTAQTTNPSLGNGTLQARFKLRNSFVSVFYHLTMGNTTTYGNGFWLLSIPVAAINSGRSWGKGNFQCADSTAGGGSGSGNAYLFTTSTIVFDNIASRANINSSVPFVWATNDQFYGDFCYYI